MFHFWFSFLLYFSLWRCCLNMCSDFVIFVCLANIIESVLSGRVYFSRGIQNFKIKVGVGGSLTTQNNLTDLPAAAYYYHFGDGNLSRSYLVSWATYSSALLRTLSRNERLIFIIIIYAAVIKILLIFWF